MHVHVRPHAEQRAHAPQARARRLAPDAERQLRLVSLLLRLLRPLGVGLVERAHVLLPLLLALPLVRAEEAAAAGQANQK